MIVECIAILAVVAQIRASECNLSSMVGSSLQSSPVVLVSSANSGFPESSSGTMMRNIVAKGKYPVALRNYEPSPRPVSIINSRVTTPVQEKPTIRLPASIPAPRTISHSCTCYKTILRPRIHQQLITVPSLQRYVETSHKPIFENIQYEALPLTSDGSGVRFVQLGAGSSGGMMTLGSGSIGSQAQNIPSIMVPQIHNPRVQIVEAQRIQPFQVSEIQTVPMPQPVSFGSCSCQC